MFARLWDRLVIAGGRQLKALASQRESHRRFSGRVAFCEVIGLPTNTPLLVTVRDIAEGGVGLLCDKSIDPGTFLAVKLEGAEGFTRLVRARIIHATKTGEDWLLGCALVDRLESREVTALV
jgi:hypothetical protein